MHSIGTWWLWTFFFLFISSVIFIDIIIFRKNDRPFPVKAAFAWTLIWILCALSFNVVIWWNVNMTSGPVIAHQKALEFFTGYVIEEILSIDNMFAFLIIFNYFNVSIEHQRRVLLWGVTGAVVMRLIMILFGAWLITKIHWILYLFGVFLFLTGIKMLFFFKEKRELKDNFLLKWLQKHVRLTSQFQQEKFFIKRNKLWYATPLFLTLIMIEVSDLVFALDSIPAVFAITNDPFIVFTSNIFAILGLRALYFVLRDAANRFYLLKYSVALILTFIGAKMMIKPWFDMPIQFALGVVVIILFTSIIVSSLTRKKYKA